MLSRSQAFAAAFSAKKALLNVNATVNAERTFTFTSRGPVINHGNAGNQTKGPASATISKESGGLPHGKPREAPRKLRKIPRKFREFWWNFWVSSSVRRALFQARLVM